MAEVQLEKVTLVGGEQIHAHLKDDCRSAPCCIHSPTDHHMKEWPQHWRNDRGIMERICPHGIGHPDPDDLAIREDGEGRHGCDGCCHVATAAEPCNCDQALALKEAGAALLRKLDQVHEDIGGIFALSQLRSGVAYQGANWTKEYNALAELTEHAQIEAVPEP